MTSKKLITVLMLMLHIFLVGIIIYIVYFLPKSDFQEVFEYYTVIFMFISYLIPLFIDKYFINKI